MPAKKPIPFEGVLNCWNDEHDLPDLILSVSRSGKTGRLQFSNAEADKTLYVKDGKIVFAESSSDDDGLGQYLLRVGKISLDDYVRVSKMVEPGKRLGALLVAEGVLEPKDLVPAVVGQVRAVILGLFRRTETWYGFREEQLTRKESITLDISVAQLILDGVQQVDSWRRVSKGVGELDRVYQVSEAGRDDWAKLELEENLVELLGMLEQPTSVAEVCTRASASDFDACRYLWAFRVLGWIAPAVAKEEVEKDSAVDAEEASSSETSDSELPPIEDTLDDAALVEAASASAESASPSPQSPPSKPIPERLIQTRVSSAPPQPPKAATPSPPSPAPPAPPQQRPIPEDLSRTQLAVGSPRPSPERTSPDVSSKPTSREVPDDLVHTRLDVAPPAIERKEEPVVTPPSATEMMEAILSGDNAKPELAGAKPASAPSPRADAATQFFAGPSALETPLPGSDLDPFAAVSYDSFGSDDLASSFDALSLDESPAPAKPEVPASSGPSFEDLALSDPAVTAAPPPSPEPEPEPEPALPVLEGDVVDPEPLPEEGGGMEFLMASDPMKITEADPMPPPAFTTHDPFQFGEEPVAAAIPRRPMTDEMDLDAEGLGHVLRRDD